MKKDLLLILLFLLCFFNTSLAQEEIFKITVIDIDTNKPIANCAILEHESEKLIGLTNDKGILKFSSNVSLDNVIIKTNKEAQIVNLVGNEMTFVIHNTDSTNKDEAEDIQRFHSGSSSNEWIGASIAYNIGEESNDANNFIGSTKVKLNTALLSDKYKHFDLNIIGNIGNFINSGDTINTSGLTAIAQSTQGISVGIEPLVTLKNTKDGNFTWRAWTTFNYKFNSYKKNVSDEDIENVPLHQGRFTIGTEIDFIKFEGKRRMHMGIEGAYTVFNASDYETIFLENKSNLLSASISFIMPLTGRFGLSISETFTEGKKPIFTAGFIIATN